MKIACISPSFYPAFYYGGPIFSTYYNALELSKLGVEIYVSTTDANGDESLDVKTNMFIEHTKNFFIKYYSPSTKNGFSYKMFGGLKKDIEDSDIVYTQSVFSLSTVLTFYFSKKSLKPLIFSPRGQLGEWCLNAGSSFKKLWLRFFIKPYADKIHWHVTSDQEKNEVLAVFPGSKVNVIANGIDLNQFESVNGFKDRRYYKRYTSGKNFSNIIVSMGRLHSKKGFDILIEAIKGVTEKYPDTALLIAGEDYGEKRNLEETAIQNGLSNSVFFTGQINDVQEKIDFFSNADIFALPSHNENFGIVYAEALAAGTPVVASTGTPWEIVEEFNCGKWVENTSEQFQKAIEELLGSDVAGMGNNGRRLIAEKFGWSAIAKQFKTTFEEMLSERE
ncbi:MAG: glycosyltransferase [Ignavibacteriales bacterium]|nr:MAG: glycosyltransferase [Ignavibacteriales bacterium]